MITDEMLDEMERFAQPGHPIAERLEKKVRIDRGEEILLLIGELREMREEYSVKATVDITSDIKPKGYEVDISSCARCGNCHWKLSFKGFSERPVPNYSLWALCPSTGEPILMTITQDGKG